MFEYHTVGGAPIDMRLLSLAMCIVTVSRLVATIGLHKMMPHRLTTDALSAYLNKTFGPLQRCLKVAFDDSAEASAIAAMFHHETTANACRTIDLDDTGDGPIFCPAYVVVGRHLEVVERFMENFRNSAAERMLVIIVQDRKYIKPFIKVSSIPVHGYKCIILQHTCLFIIYY